MYHVKRTNSPAPLAMLILLAAVAAIPGCTSLAESIAEHLAEKNVSAIEQEFKLFEAELGLFRHCLKQRGGSCQGTDTTALPHTSQHAMSRVVNPVHAGSSQILANSVAKLPAGHPAQSGLALLSHPVVGQATGLYNHLRGHDTGSVAGFTVEKGTGDHGGPESTATMNLGVAQVQHFHEGLLSSLGTTAWESLHGHCAALLAAHGNAPGRTALEADCRRVAFIRAYLQAYMRKDQFLEVELQLAGAIQAVNGQASAIESDIDGLLASLKQVEADVARDEASTLQEISGGAGRVGGEVEALVGKVKAALEKRFGKDASAIFGNLAGLAGDISAKSEALAQAADNAVANDVKTLVAELDGLLGKVKAQLGEIKMLVATADKKVDSDISGEITRADTALSNVFKVSNVGYVSRDQSFRSMLPTLKFTLDPTVNQPVKVTDVEPGPHQGQVLTRASDFGELGVATDSSGVGTGSSIGAEVVRVFLEAIFDAHEGLPAIAAANLPNIKPTALTLGEYSLPLFTSPLGNIDSGDLTRMTHTNDQVAAKTRAIMSRVIAGIGPFSLNNQPLEDFIVEIITTSVRQATSKATWCWYACNLNVDVKTLETDASKAVDEKVTEVEANVKKKADAEAEHVKLRLKLGE